MAARLAALALFAVMSSAAYSQASATTPIPETPFVSPADEPLVADMQERARNAGAMGFYVDRSSNVLVAVVPRALIGTFDTGMLATAPVDVEIKWTDLDGGVVNGVRTTLQNLMSNPKFSSETMSLQFDAEREKLLVSTSVPFDVVASVLRDNVSLVDYRKGGAAELLTGRLADVSPFHGAAKIKFDGDPGNWCTSGFAVTNGSQRAMLIPSHCGDVQTVTRTWAGVSIGTTGSDRHCGPSPSGDNSDFQFVRGASYTDDIYLGTSPGFLGDVLDAGVPAVGSTYRFSGATSNESSQVEMVTDTDASYWIKPIDSWCAASGWWLLHLIAFHSDSVCDAQRGDSGAPFYFRSSSSPYNVRLRGMVVARQILSDGITVGPDCYAVKTSTISSLSGYSALTSN